MSLTLYILGGAALLWALAWLIGRFSRPAALTRMSDGWLDGHKYNRRQDRPD